MKTITDLINDWVDEIKKLLDELLLKHSSIYRMAEHPDFIVIIADGNYRWGEIKIEGRAIQSKVLEEYRRFSATIRTLMREQPKKNLQVLDKSERIINRAIEQDKGTFFKTPEEALKKVIEALDAQKQSVANLYSKPTGHPIFVPDTNALLFNPNLEDWRFSDAPYFKIVLTPTVLSELDELKVTYRNENVRKKAKSLVTRISSYRTRGRLTEGVTLVRDASMLVALAVEPDFKESLPWLDRDNKDDRVTATLIEIMRLNPKSPVILVTRDINLQNKAEFARIPFREPPPPKVKKP